MGFASRHHTSAVATVGAMVAAVAAAAAPPHHRHSSTLQQRHSHHTRNHPPHRRDKANGWLLCFYMFARSFLLTVLPVLTQTHAFSPPHRHIERPRLPSSEQKNSKERSNVSFLFTIPPYINISPFNFSIKLLLPDEPPQSLPQLRHTPATRAHQRHHPPAIEWGRQKRLVFLFF